MRFCAASGIGGPHVPAVVWVVIGLVVFVGALLAVDWLMAGRKKRHLLVNPDDQSGQSTAIGYGTMLGQQNTLKRSGG
jgi:hypothetical protein